MFFRRGDKIRSIEDLVEVLCRQTWQRKKTNRRKRNVNLLLLCASVCRSFSRPATSRHRQDKFDYASDLYTECVRGDPGNLEYLQSFMTNLHKKYGSVKKLGPMVQFKERGARAALKKAIAQCDWDEAIQQGITVLAGESLGRSHVDRDGHGLRRHHEPGGRLPPP